jgi:electron transfer flavoprotein beta subunit
LSFIQKEKVVIIIMKVLVGVKRVVDYAVKVRVSKGTVDLANVKQSMNPFCEVSGTSM